MESKKKQEIYKFRRQKMVRTCHIQRKEVKLLAFLYDFQTKSYRSEYADRPPPPLVRKNQKTTNPPFPPLSEKNRKQVDTDSLCLSQTVVVCHRISLLVRENICLSKKLSDCDRQSVTFPDSLFLSQSPCVCHRQFMSVTESLLSFSLCLIKHSS